MAEYTSVWDQFALDPRHPANAAMRAADADREVVRGVLTEAYGDGRLDQQELDERADALTVARTLGELPPLMLDLVPDTAPVRHSATAPASRPADVHTQAVAKFQRDRREHVMAWLGPTLICWVIWSLTMFGHFPWPAIVTVATFIPLGRDLLLRKDIIADHEQSLQRKAAKAEQRRLEQQRRGELPPAPDDY